MSFSRANTLDTGGRVRDAHIGGVGGVGSSFPGRPNDSESSRSVPIRRHGAGAHGACRLSACRVRQPMPSRLQHALRPDQLRKRAVGPVREQVRGRAAFDDAAGVEHEHRVRRHHRGEPVRDLEHRAPG
eukprot:CAMPEP_0172176232 /NCGR_PEP_ID=MMETSP1050-20130122/14682_1 /TAXON_ID=233186 /ORGANISM="Cryptomonas curvata, Strain CCAP979/52" /LENGTH=128 /DNA_ID=CAMNT_0012848449 /DNA_START=410 /DNA_END=792 /DNA_ORIENTATION=+